MAVKYDPSGTTNFISKNCNMWRFCGLSNMWVDEIYESKITKSFHRFVTFSLVFFIMMEFLSFYTQGNLSDKQTTDLILFSISHPVLFSYYIACEYYKKEFKDLFLKLCIILKEDFNDPEAERRMIKKATYYSVALFANCAVALISYGFDGLMQVIRSDGSFTTVVIAWPYIEDTSTIANLIRLISYILWWTFMTRVSAAIGLVVVTTILLSHQYINLQSYFYSLNNIFDDVNEENIEQKQLEYEKCLKVGIKLHSETLWCTRQCQNTCSLHFSGQIIVNVTVFCILMLQMVNSDRTLMNTVAIVTTTVALLTSTGFIMWTAGDITVEAASISTEIYSSGWQHCRGKTSVRVRKLIVMAMTQAQKNVVMRSLGIIEISYQSYLTIVKSSYSVFSLLY